MKNIKKIIIVACALFPFTVLADGGIIGTGVLHDTFGIPNLYYQHQLSGNSAFVLGYGSVNNVDLGGSFGTITGSATGVSYKRYADSYASGAYYQLGLASINVESSTSGAASGLGVIAVVGYETAMTSNLVLGGEAGWGTANGFGLIGINIAYKF